MIARFPGTCRGCGDAIAKGDEIYWSPDDGERCLDCGPAQPDERRGSATADEDMPGYVRDLRKRITAAHDAADNLARSVLLLTSKVEHAIKCCEAIASELDIELPELAE